jgi:hypothetical protein
MYLLHCLRRTEKLLQRTTTPHDRCWKARQLEFLAHCLSRPETTPSHRLLVCLCLPHLHLLQAFLEVCPALRLRKR